MEGTYYSDRGGRDYNEDTAEAVLINDYYCGIVADGLGGHGGGDVASSAAVRLIEENLAEYREKKVTKEAYTEWFNKANEKVLSLQQDDCKMKTTLAVLCINEQERNATWAHLGDTRIYHFIDGRMEFVTFDHSVSRMAVLAGEIEMDQVRFHPDRNKLIKAVGKENVGSPEYGECYLEEGRRHAFLVCSDGFWEYVTEEEMEATLQSSSDMDDWLQQMVGILRNKVASKNVNNDNYSLVILAM